MHTHAHTYKSAPVPPLLRLQTCDHHHLLSHYRHPYSSTTFSATLSAMCVCGPCAVGIFCAARVYLVRRKTRYARSELAINVKTMQYYLLA